MEESLGDIADVLKQALLPQPPPTTTHEDTVSPSVQLSSGHAAWAAAFGDGLLRNLMCRWVRVWRYGGGLFAAFGCSLLFFGGTALAKNNTHWVCGTVRQSYAATDAAPEPSLPHSTM